MQPSANRHSAGKTCAEPEAKPVDLSKADEKLSSLLGKRSDLRITGGPENI